MSDLESRIDGLEVRLTYHDDSIETLNAAILAQWTQIDELTRQLASLRAHLQETEASAPTQQAENEQPPHY